MTSEIFDLICLCVDDIACVIEVGVDQFPVGRVDKWSEVHDAHRQQGETPKWQKLDEPVARECSNEGLLTLVDDEEQRV